MGKAPPAAGPARDVLHTSKPRQGIRILLPPQREAKSLRYEREQWWRSLRYKAKPVPRPKPEDKTRGILPPPHGRPAGEDSLYTPHRSGLPLLTRCAARELYSDAVRP